MSVSGVRVHWSHEAAQVCPGLVVTDVTFDTGGYVSGPGTNDSRRGALQLWFAQRPGIRADD